MRTQTCMDVRMLFAGAMTLVCVSTGAQAGFTWTGDMGLNWFDTANWLFMGREPSTPPGCGDATGVNVMIDEGEGPILVKCASGGPIVLNELLSSESMNIATTLQLDGDSDLFSPVSIETFSLVANASLLIDGDEGIWDRGAFDGAGVIGICGTLGIQGVGGRALGAWLDNDGTVNQDAGLTLTNWRGIDARIVNRSHWRGQGTISRENAPTAKFLMTGGEVKGMSLMSGTATGPLRFTLPFDIEQSGVVHAESADVRISGGGDHGGSGQYMVSDNHEILIDTFPGASALVISGTYTASGTGQIEVAEGLVITGSLTADLSDESNEGFHLGGASSLSITGSGTFKNSGRMVWEGGPICSAMMVENASGGTVEVVDGGSVGKVLQSGTVMLNKGNWKHNSAVEIDALSELRTMGGGGVVDMLSGEINGLGVMSFSDEGFLRVPPEASDGFKEISCALDLNNAGVFNSDGGELRLTGVGSWVGSTVECSSSLRENVKILIRGGPYSGSGLTFDGTAQIAVEANSEFEVAGEVTNSMGGFLKPGFFRLGDSNSGELLYGQEDGSRFVNNGAFIWQNGKIDIGVPKAAIGVGIETISGFINQGNVFTGDSGIRQIEGVYVNASGESLFGTSVQVGPDPSAIFCSGGTIKQTGSTMSLLGGLTPALVNGGTWELNGNAGINGQGGLVLDSGVFKKTGGGTSTVSVQTIPGDGADVGMQVEVDGGTLRFTDWPGEPMGAVKWTVWADSKVEINGMVQNFPPPSVIPQIQGSLSLALNGALPPEFECELLTLDGRIRPGGVDGAGEFILDGDLDMTETGIVSVNIEAGANDLLTIEGSAALEGTLRVDLLNDFLPTIGSSFAVATASGGMTGSFDEVIGDGLWSYAIVDDALVVTLEALPTCEADFANLDGVVDTIDLLALLSAWGFSPSSMADFNGDDVVDTLDLLDLLGGWGPCSGD